MNRRHAMTAVLAAMAAARGVGAQQGFPSKPVRIIVGYSTGGAVDLIARALGQPLSVSLGQPVLVENKPGAGTNIANRALIDSAPDGHTLMLAANALAANPSLYHPAPYDLERDVVPIAQIGRVPVVIAVSEKSALKTLAQAIEASKARPGSLSFATPGNGSTPHLAVELFAHAAGIRLMHVPYKGGSQAMTDVIGGVVDMVAVNALEVQPHARAGRLRVLACLSPARSPIFPDAPTIAESGFPGFEAAVWYGLIAPAGTPADRVALLHEHVQRALATDEVKARLVSSGGEVTPGPTSQFAALLRSERARYERLIRDAAIKPD
jgi:tripartite-type tricarboxylate transporter receptor subunit TctC